MNVFGNADKNHPLPNLTPYYIIYGLHKKFNISIPTKTIETMPCLPKQYSTVS